MRLNKEGFITFKNRLIRISDKEPLSKMSLVVIIALDIFVIQMIFAGLADHSAQLTSPYEHMPGVCRQAIVENQWVGDNKTDNLQRTLLYPESSYRYKAYDILDEDRIEQTHPACAELLRAIAEVKKDKTLLDTFRKRDQAQKRKRQLNQSFKQSKDVYDTNLLESIADDSESAPQSAVSLKSKQLSKDFNAVTGEIASYDEEIHSSPTIASFSGTLARLQQGAAEIRKDLKTFDFWYPIKLLGWQFLFLIPLCGLFYFWNARSIEKNSHLQILISSHLLVVSFIPVLFKIIKLLLDIVPRRLFESLFILLKSLKIIAIWHYILIVLGIIAALVIIYIIQKKLFSREKILEKRLIKGCCRECGKKLPVGSHHCPFCGTDQERVCGMCGDQTPIAGRYCVRCGEPNS